jgi:SM-20-related protein
MAMLDALIDGLAERGYAIAPHALPSGLVQSLRTRVLSMDHAGDLRAAGIGRAAGRSDRPDIRGDRTAWLDDAPGDPAEREFLAWLDALRLRCNRELMMGAADVEAHYAIYPPGARYARHRDRFRDDDARVLSCVLYLNDAWDADDGGELVLHVGKRTVEVKPAGGTFVAFLSAGVEHEVLPSRRERLSLAGWLRRRARNAC